MAHSVYFFNQNLLLLLVLNQKKIEGQNRGGRDFINSNYEST